MRGRHRPFLSVVTTLAMIAPWTLVADERGKKDDQPGEQEERAEPEEQRSETRHQVMVDGRDLSDTATAGTLVLEEEDGRARASVFYIAYTLNGADDPSVRPVTLSFNGPRGSSSVWLHLGVLGPRRVLMDDEGMPLAPPYRLVDDPDSILDLTDLVFIDPVMTGYSRAVPDADPKQSHGVEEDVGPVAELIRLQRDLRATVESAEEIALGGYTLALMQGDDLPRDDREQVIQKLARYTGLAPEYLRHSNMRIHIRWFVKELRRDDRLTVGRLDSRFSGRDRDAVGESFESDPSLAAIRGPYTGTSSDYVRRELGFETDLPHEILTSRVRPRNYGDFQNRYVDVAETLRQVMTMNPVSRSSWPADTAISRRPVSRPGTHSTISVSSRSSRTTSGWATPERVT